MEECFRTLSPSAFHSPIMHSVIFSQNFAHSMVASQFVARQSVLCLTAEEILQIKCSASSKLVYICATFLFYEQHVL